jgi:hypothetical protein
VEGDADECRVEGDADERRLLVLIPIPIPTLRLLLDLLDLLELLDLAAPNAHPGPRLIHRGEPSYTRGNQEWRG